MPPNLKILAGRKKFLAKIFRLEYILVHARRLYMFTGHEFDPQYTLALRLADDMWRYLFRSPTKDEIPALLRKYA